MTIEGTVDLNNRLRALINLRDLCMETIMSGQLREHTVSALCARLESNAHFPTGEALDAAGLAPVRFCTQRTSIKRQ